ncbi:PAP2-domain-containing protein [Clavulina sp. PMI_390]|nr:PAP2-domain-containing protein [Clavulina sp. PMI_390]
MQAPMIIRLGIPILYITAITLPITSQFFFPALPIFTWLITFFTSRFIPVEYRPPISVSLLPTLESVLYGANISDILTRFTHPILDIPAWISYGVVHFTGPFVLAAFLWLFGARGGLQYWAKALGYLNLTGVVIQILFPCAPPWYELRNGLTPADYTMKGSPGGLARIDALFHSNGYTETFSNAPVVFGAFPSLHAGDATLAALFVSHFWPFLKPYAWAYCGVLYWATMYLTHHYLIDATVGSCLSILFFYLFMPDSLREPDNTTNLSYAVVNGLGALPRDRYAEYDLEVPRTGDSAARLFSRDSLSEDEDAPPNPLTPYGHSRRTSSPFPGNPPINSPRVASAAANSSAAKSHRHTASIASLIRADERVEEGWSPAIPSGLATPSTAPPVSIVEGGIVRSRSPSWPDEGRD